MNKWNISEKTIVETKCDSVNHTRFPKEYHLADWACEKNQVKKGDHVVAYTVIRKDFVTGYGLGHIYLWAVCVTLCFCMMICQASSINATWDKESLLTEILCIISGQNAGRYTPSWDLVYWKICDL